MNYSQALWMKEVLMNPKTYIIGAGGVGSWLAPAITLLVGNESVTVIDGDKLEVKNLNRQLFSHSDVGRFKSDALAERYGCFSIPKWYGCGLMGFSRGDTLMCAVDNHTARSEVLKACDECGCLAIIGANEVYSSEAYLYRPEWKDTQLDPRVYYPEIVTDRSGDPRRAAIGCTGEAQKETPQLVTANFMAAALMMHLFIPWVFEARKYDKSAREHLAHRLTSNLSKLTSTKTGVPTPQTKE
jgi:molybdopterin/thiamine biosynthesis adenylyltransferase